MFETIALAIGFGFLFASPLIGLLSLPSMIMNTSSVQIARANINRPFILKNK